MPAKNAINSTSLSKKGIAAALVVGAIALMAATIGTPSVHLPVLSETTTSEVFSEDKLSAQAIAVLNNGRAIVEALHTAEMNGYLAENVPVVAGTPELARSLKNQELTGYSGEWLYDGQGTWSPLTPAGTEAPWLGGHRAYWGSLVLRSGAALAPTGPLYVKANVSHSICVEINRQLHGESLAPLLSEELEDHMVSELKLHPWVDGKDTFCLPGGGTEDNGGDVFFLVKSRVQRAG